jgi:glycine cleavage system protein P-like pyridoxal-binding family
MADFKAKLQKHSSNLAALMITFPSTAGRYDENIK